MDSVLVTAPFAILADFNLILLRSVFLGDEAVLNNLIHIVLSLVGVLLVLYDFHVDLTEISEILSWLEDLPLVAQIQ